MNFLDNWKTYHDQDKLITDIVTAYRKTRYAYCAHNMTDEEIIVKATKQALEIINMVDNEPNKI